MSNPVIDRYGNKWWYNSKGELHRVGGPAGECLGGSNHWWVDGNKHRLDGPAYEGADGTREWWVDGVAVAEKDYLEAVLLYGCKVVLES